MLICITNLGQIGLLWCKNRCSFPMRSDPTWGYILCPSSPWILLYNLDSARPLPYPRIWGITGGSGNWQLLLCPHLQELSWSRAEADSCLPHPPLSSQPPFPPLLLKCPHLEGREVEIAPNLPVKYAVGLEFWQSVSALKINLSLLVALWRTFKSPWFIDSRPKPFSLSFHWGPTALPEPNTSFSLLGPFTPCFKAPRLDVTQATPSTIFCLGNQTCPDSFTAHQKCSIWDPTHSLGLLLVIG